MNNNDYIKKKRNQLLEKLRRSQGRREKSANASFKIIKTIFVILILAVLFYSII